MYGHALVAIVDDDESARSSIMGLVRALGFGAACFAGAAEFLGSPERRHARCLIADVRMPGMGGIELYRRLAASGAAIPTILVTAYPDAVTRAHARDIGIGCYLAKPFPSDDLLRCLLRAVAAAPP